MRNPVVVSKQKFDGSAKPDWRGDLVEAIGERWLVVYHEVEHVTALGTVATQGIRYYGMREPLTVLASFDAAGKLLCYQCDAALPARIEGRSIAFVDLDLDVIATPALATFVRDQEVFERRRVEMEYSEEAVAAAHEGIVLAQELIAARETPFDGHAERTLGMVLAARGPL